MFREVLKSKIHRATVTDANLNYQGSITLDPVLMEMADIREFEKIHVVDVNNGQRFETYVIRGRPGSGEVVINGAAARLVQVGDTVILMTFLWLDEERLPSHAPRIVQVDASNHPR